MIIEETLKKNEAKQFNVYLVFIRKLINLFQRKYYLQLIYFKMIGNYYF